MPASAVSGIFTTSIYFISLLMLLALLLNPVIAAYRLASLQAATHLASGVATELNDLTPGMTTSVEFDSYPGTSEQVSLSGTLVTAEVNGQTATAELGVPAANSTLLPGTLYEVYLSGGVAQVV